jgi:uncharacterized membrane protein
VVGRETTSSAVASSGARSSTPRVDTVARARNVRWAAPVTLPLALIGLALSIYLTYVHFHQSALVGCPESSHINCAKVTTSSQSEIFGHIPVAITGLAYYIVMVALVSPWAWRAANPWISRLRLAGAISGVGMICYLVFVEAVQLKAICLYCTGVHIVTFLLFLAILAAYLLRPLDPIES